MKRKSFIAIFMLLFIAAAMAGCSKKETITLTAEHFVAELGEDMPENMDYYVNGSEKALGDCELDLSEIDVYMAGTYNGKVIFGKTEYPFTVEVKDTIAPQTKLLAEEFRMEVDEYIDLDEIFDEIEEADEYVIRFTYGETVLEDEGLTFEEPGEYDIEAVIEDLSGNRAEFTIKVFVEELSIPVFSGLTDVTIRPGQEFDWLAGVTATDTRDGDLTSKIEVDLSGIDMEENGEYEAYYTVEDEDDNTGEGVRVVFVEGNPDEEEEEEPEVLETEDATIPELHGIVPYTINLGDPLPDFMAGITAFDAKDGDLTNLIELDTSEIDPNEPGEYTVHYTVYDRDDNEGYAYTILTIVGPVEEPETEAPETEAPSE